MSEDDLSAAQKNLDLQWKLEAPRPCPICRSMLVEHICGGLSRDVLDDRGPWIRTFTKRKFFLRDPLVEDFNIQDIAHSLATTSRFGGHAPEPYSNAQHSVLVMRHVRELFTTLKEVPPEWPPMSALLMAALLHDATEAYTNDVYGPLRHWMRERALSAQRQSDYEAVYRPIEQALLQWADLPVDVLRQWLLHKADAEVTLTEARDVLEDADLTEWDQWRDGSRPLSEKLSVWSWQHAEATFLAAYYRCNAAMQLQAKEVSGG